MLLRFQVTIENSTRANDNLHSRLKVELDRKNEIFHSS